MRGESTLKRIVAAVALVAALTLVPAWVPPAEALHRSSVFVEAYCPQSLPATTTIDPAVRPLAERARFVPSFSQQNALVGHDLAADASPAPSPDEVVAPKSGFNPLSEARIARYQAHVDRLRAAGYSGERLAELQGRVDMLGEGYVRSYSSKLTGNLRIPGGGHGRHGFDQVFRRVGDPTDLAVLESKYSAGFRLGDDPVSLLRNTRMGRQMSMPWCEGTICRMITGPHPHVRQLIGTRR